MRLFFQSLCCLFLLLGANTYGSTILVLGDSLSAGYGINPEKGWVNLLQNDLHPEHKIVNGSISGDTTGGGLERLPLLLEKFQPDFVVLELGGNDGLRGHPLSLMKKNLSSMIELCREKKAVPILFGMRIPPNYGRRYTGAFAAVYPALAEEQLMIGRLILENNLNPFGMSWKNFTVAADEENKLLGFGQIKKHDGVEELASLVVNKSQQGLGISTLLMDSLLAHAKRPLWLMCESPLTAYYSRFGFEEVKGHSKLPAYFRTVDWFSRYALSLVFVFRGTYVAFMMLRA
jgi:acyl-CoA thioesterase-1